MSDEDLRDLERRAASDSAAAVRFARALARRGDVARAASTLARVIETAPADQEALSALDALTRGGIDPAAPWPGARGDARHSGRSIAAGPVRGGQVTRIPLRELRPRQGFAVDASSRVLVVDAYGQGDALVAIQEGGLERLGAVTSGAPLLLAGRTLVVGTPGSASKETGSHVLHAIGAGVAHVFTPFVAGLGHVVFAKARHRIEARSLPTHDAPLRWAAPVPRAAAAIALGPGAIVLVLTSSGLGARGSFHRFELGTGRALPVISLERLGTANGAIVAAEDGTTFLGLSGSTLALDAEGAALWRHESSGFPAALAGEGADVLVVCEHGTFRPRALDARTGSVLWESRDACLNSVPKIDASGPIFWRREEELVAFEPRTGKVVYQALVGAGFWEFAFDGRGHALALNYGTRELIVLE